MSADETAQLVERYQAGALIKELAREFGINRQTVSKLLARAGVPLRPRGLSPSQVAEAARLYETGWSLFRIGEQLRVDHTTVRRQLLKRGVQMRDSHGRET
ncbi:helix-turn-helix domain-containing protein [Rhodococcus opacus]|nr:helix-turn-helix domain-containing protein [Rhodococcus opacus]